MYLSRLIYSSKRVPEEKLDLMSLLQNCVENNKKNNITGMLWYDGNNFIQVLEGGREFISDLYLKIAEDKRHEDVRLVSFEDIDYRDFDAWAMGLAYDGNEGKNANKHLKYAVSTKLNPSQIKSTSLLEMMKECREDI